MNQEIIADFITSTIDINSIYFALFIWQNFRLHFSTIHHLNGLACEVETVNPAMKPEQLSVNLRNKGFVVRHKSGKRYKTISTAVNFPGAPWPQ